MDDPSHPSRRPCAGGAGKRRSCWARPGSDWCRNHDPELAVQRRANGARRREVTPLPSDPVDPRRADPSLGLPPGHRPEWNPTKRQLKMARSLERAVEILEAELPPLAELRVEALKTLRSIALDAGLSDTARVGAANALLKATAPAAPGDQPAAPAETLEEILAS